MARNDGFLASINQSTDGGGRTADGGTRKGDAGRALFTFLLPPSSFHLQCCIFRFVSPALIIAVASFLCLPLTAVGLPGSWLLLAGVGLWKTFEPSSTLSWTGILIAFALATIAELIEFGLASRYTTKYGGSRRAGWGALIGGIAGAIVGVPIPIIGSIVGSFAGAFVGALVAEYSHRQEGAQAGRVAWGALVGRVFATGAKVALAVVISVILVLDALR